MEFPVFGENEPKYASWADEMDEVDPILPTTIKENEPKYASWADEMDEVDPILPDYTLPITQPISTMLPTIYEEDEDEDEDDSAYGDSFSDADKESIETNDSEELNLDAPPKATKLGKKVVRFAEWKNEVFEVPADKDARKIADIRYLYPRWEEEEDSDSGYDDDDDDEF